VTPPLSTQLFFQVFEKLGCVCLSAVDAPPCPSAPNPLV